MDLEEAFSLLRSSLEAQHVSLADQQATIMTACKKATRDILTVSPLLSTMVAIR